MDLLVVLPFRGTVGVHLFQERLEVLYRVVKIVGGVDLDVLPVLGNDGVLAGLDGQGVEGVHRSPEHGIVSLGVFGCDLCQLHFLLAFGPRLGVELQIVVGHHFPYHVVFQSHLPKRLVAAQGKVVEGESPVFLGVVGKRGRPVLAVGEEAQRILPFLRGIEDHAVHEVEFRIRAVGFHAALEVSPGLGVVLGGVELLGLEEIAFHQTLPVDDGMHRAHREIFLVIRESQRKILVLVGRVSQGGVAFFELVGHGDLDGGIFLDRHLDLGQSRVIALVLEKLVSLGCEEPGAALPSEFLDDFLDFFVFLRLGVASFQ